MELLEGEDLAQRIDRAGALPPSDVVTIVQQVCRALSRAHASGVVHRDIKPDNIYLTDSDGELFVKVLDFGIAKRVEKEKPLGMTSSGVMVGTPCYMSPEQVLSAKDVDFSCDSWALAVVAYQALTGCLPFAGETVGAISVAVDRGIFELPSSRRPELGSAIDVWFSRALARNASTRFGSPKEMAETFRHAAAMADPYVQPAEHPLAHVTFDEDRASQRSVPANVSDSNAPHVLTQAPRPRTAHGAWRTKALWGLSATLAVGVISGVIAVIALTARPGSFEPAPAVVAAPAVLAPNLVQVQAPAASTPVPLPTASIPQLPEVVVQPVPAASVSAPKPARTAPARARPVPRAVAPRMRAPAPKSPKSTAAQPAKDRGF
jgi:serine/threonine-protein kinase